MVKINGKPKPLSLYPLKFEEVISDVLKVRPEPKESKLKPHKTIRKKAKTK